MPENYKTKLVLFDLDGTLIDTAPDFLLSLNNVLNKYGKESVTIDEIRMHISEGSAKLIKFCAVNTDKSPTKSEFFRSFIIFLCDDG